MKANDRGQNVRWQARNASRLPAYLIVQINLILMPLICWYFTSWKEKYFRAGSGHTVTWDFVIPKLMETRWKWSRHKCCTRPNENNGVPSSIIMYTIAGIIQTCMEKRSCLCAGSETLPLTEVINEQLCTCHQCILYFGTQTRYDTSRYRATSYGHLNRGLHCYTNTQHTCTLQLSNAKGE